MDRPYDSTLKMLAELSPPDWLPLVGRPRRPVTVEETDIGTILSGAADKLFRVHDDPEYLMHLDFQSGHDTARLPLRLRLYNSVYEYRHDRLVLSVPVLLHPGADSPQLNGLLRRGFEGEEPISTLRYQVIRVWRLPVEPLLAGGIGTLALAPVSDVREGDVPGVIRRMKERLRRARRAPAGDVLLAAFVLLGLRYSRAFAQQLYQEVLGMEESASYQLIVERGEAKGLRRAMLLLGEDRFGPPSDAVKARLNEVDDIERLEELTGRLLHVGSWEELLRSLGPRRSGRRRPRS
jgi:predicted transposase YdaD